MSARVVRYEPRPGVTQLAMRGDGRNPLDLDLVRSVADHLEELDGDAACRAVVLSSEDRHFCAGATSKISGAGPSWSTEDLYAQVPRLAAFGKALVIALNGAAVGGGVGLAMWGDWRQMARDARLQVNFSRLGYTPGFGLTATLPALLGGHRAAELMMSGRSVGADEALRIGLCDGLSAADDLLHDAIERATVFAAAAPLASRAVKTAARRALIASIPGVLSDELSEQTRLKATADYAEGMAAVKEGRAPEFTGQ